MPYKDPNTARLYQRTYQRNRRRQLRLACITQLGGQCVDCGESDPSQLEFDCVRPDSIDPSRPHIRIGNLLRLKGGLNSPILQRELARCELRCTACHAVKDGRLNRNKWGEFKRDGKSSWPGHLQSTDNPFIDPSIDEIPF